MEPSWAQVKREPTAGAGCPCRHWDTASRKTRRSGTDAGRGGADGELTRPGGFALARQDALTQPLVDSDAVPRRPIFRTSLRSASPYRREPVSSSLSILEAEPLQIEAAHPPDVQAALRACWLR